MSALGQKQTLRRSNGMSALPPKADIRQRKWHVRFCARSGSRRNQSYARRAEAVDPLSRESSPCMSQVARSPVVENRPFPS
jgi:hypothetical protein